MCLSTFYTIHKIHSLRTLITDYGKLESISWQRKDIDHARLLCLDQLFPQLQRLPHRKHSLS
jgi:hypothetical protein